MTSKADKLPLETELVAHDNNTILTLKPGDQTLSRLTQLIIVVVTSFVFLVQMNLAAACVFIPNCLEKSPVGKGEGV